MEDDSLSGILELGCLALLEECNFSLEVGRKPCGGVPHSWLEVADSVGLAAPRENQWTLISSDLCSHLLVAALLNTSVVETFHQKILCE